MSAATEMALLVKHASKPSVAGESVKAKIARAARVLGFDRGRVKRLWYGEARVITADEMDHARRTVRARQQDLEGLHNDLATAHDYLSRLEASLASIDADFHCETIGALGNQRGRVDRSRGRE